MYYKHFNVIHLITKNNLKFVVKYKIFKNNAEKSFTVLPNSFVYVNMQPSIYLSILNTYLVQLYC